jgi:glutaminase
MSVESIAANDFTSHGCAPSPIAVYLAQLLDRHADLDEGEVATYIPELAHADPSFFGICLATVDGAVYEVGDSRIAFTLQSISKPLAYGLALEQLGEEAVARRIGVEPSGDAFNEISLAPQTGAPVNPMINAGAIACAALLVSATDEPLDLALATCSSYAGRMLAVDEAVFRSERETGHRNRAIAHLLRSVGVITGTPDAALDLYFRLCSVSVDCRDLALIAATLANGGVNPLTRSRAVSERVVRNVLAVMTSCGMYDAAGAWLCSVGLPAKSGVSGGVLAVLPGRLGIGVFSPRLDAQGNSARGIAVCRDLSRDLSLHLVRPGEQIPPPARSATSLAERPSKRVRSTAQRDAIDRAAGMTAVFELQGELGFAAVEAVSRLLEDRGEEVELVVVDLRSVGRADAGGLGLLGTLAGGLAERGGQLVLTSPQASWATATSDLAAVGPLFPDLDRALEWCEDELLLRVGAPSAPEAVELRDHPLLDGLDDEELRWLEAQLGRVVAPPGTFVVRRGEPAGDIFLLVRGSMSVLAGDTMGEPRRLETLSAGMVFGELAYASHGRRAADVRADSEVECRTLPYAAIDALQATDPRLQAKLLRNVLRVVSARTHGLNADVAMLSSR